jgi:hypothetical protein
LTEATIPLKMAKTNPKLTSSPSNGQSNENNKEIHRSDNCCIKLSWFILIIACGFLAANQCLALLLDYLSTDHWITTVIFEHPSNNGLEWPNIRVENLNAFFQSKLESERVDDPYFMATMQKPDVENLYFYDQYIAAEPIFLNFNQAKTKYALLQQDSIKHMINITWDQVSESIINI